MIQIGAVVKPKFLVLRDLIRDEILAGLYGDGKRLPTEADLSSRHKVSRVTVRKALEELKKERIIAGMQGSGTVVTLRRDGFQGALDMVVLVAPPTYGPFFAAFFGYFESVVDNHGTIVVFKQDSSATMTGTSDSYRRLLDKGIRDFVLWPGRGFSGHDLLPRLRGLGCNLVFFDHVVETDFADSVALDNQHAIATLVAALRARGCRRIDFAGWQNVPLSSTILREQAFVKIAGPAARVFKIRKDQSLDHQMGVLVERLRCENELPDAFVGLNGEIGRSLCKVLHDRGLGSVRVGMVDEISPVLGMEILCLVQPMKKMAERTFQCLIDQNRLGRRWKAGRYLFRGTLKKI